MKNIKLIINCMTGLLKKKIFKYTKTDINQECEKAFDFSESKEIDEENSQAEEYLKNYKVTTRWQTI